MEHEIGRAGSIDVSVIIIQYLLIPAASQLLNCWLEISIISLYLVWSVLSLRSNLCLSLLEWMSRVGTEQRTCWKERKVAGTVLVWSWTSCLLATPRI